ncbi:uncharacterized protein [Macrobrachium rosenbergii]|uniref:uncharacterized protein n=1 Tax=Macrobrachium rosenbergii TaxID=79674 RepID=UPI0034D3E954
MNRKRKRDPPVWVGTEMDDYLWRLDILEDKPGTSHEDYVNDVYERIMKKIDREVNKVTADEDAEDVGDAKFWERISGKHKVKRAKKKHHGKNLIDAKGREEIDENCCMSCRNLSRARKMPRLAGKTARKPMSCFLSDSDDDFNRDVLLLDANSPPRRDVLLLDANSPPRRDVLLLDANSPPRQGRKPGNSPFKSSNKNAPTTSFHNDCDDDVNVDAALVDANCPPLQGRKPDSSVFKSSDKVTVITRYN